MRKQPQIVAMAVAILVGLATAQAEERPHIVMLCIGSGSF
jgi:hypothetical protein